MSAAAAANADISHDSLQGNPGTAHHYVMQDLVEVDSNSDDEDDDNDTDGNKNTGVPISDTLSASTTRNTPHAPQAPIPRRDPPTSTTRTEPRTSHIPVPTMIPP